MGNIIGEAERSLVFAAVLGKVYLGMPFFLFVLHVFRLWKASFQILYLSVLFALAGVAAQAQTGVVNAISGQTCAAERFGGTLNCTSQDFATILSFDQPAIGALASCRAGEIVTIDVTASIQGGSASRYDIGLFTGETGVSPSTFDTGSTCSLALFPTSPSPFLDSDGDVCGDFRNQNSSASMLMQDVKVKCLPATGSNELAIPYTLVFANSASGNSCTAANIAPSTSAKCISSSAATVTNVIVNGYITVTKQTDPIGDTEAFLFSASSNETVTPSSASLSDGQSATFEVALPASGSRVLTISEAAIDGWDSTANITCLQPDGSSAASYVTIDNVARTISASLDATNFGAVCTITNTKTQEMADLVTVKTLISGDA
ncbi:hypothetical protein, partial [Ruegeria marina]